MSAKKIVIATLSCLVLFGLGFLSGFAGAGAPRAPNRRSQAGSLPARIHEGRPPPSSPKRAVAAVPLSNPDEGPAKPKAPERGALRVHVIWEETDEPAEGILVRVEPLSAPRPLLQRYEGVTDGEGVVLLDGLPPGEAQVPIDRAWLRGSIHRPRIIPGETLDVLLRLPEDLTVEGVVVDEAGRPVSGAEVWLSRGPFNRLAANLVVRAGADGTFRLRGVQQGRYMGARAASWSPSSLKVVNGKRGETVSLRLVLPGPGGALRGRVLGPRGEPLAGAFVVVGDRKPTATWTASPAPVPAETAEDGSFEIEGLSPGETPVAARAPGLAPAEFRVSIEAGRAASV